MFSIGIKTKGKWTCMAEISLFYIVQNVLLKDWHSLPSGTNVVPASNFRLSAIFILLNAGKKYMELAWFAVKIGSLL
jgi:hypothetical protein